MTKANWNYPTAVKFGAGRIAELPEALKTAGIARPLLVTDAGLASLPVTQNTLKLVRDAGFEVGVFADVKPNPISANVNAGIEVLRQGGHDGVIAFGGGSALDLGKLVAFQAGQSRPVWDFEDIGDWWTRADADGIAPIVAVPTTAGTGSEVGRAGVITHEATHTKKVIFHPKMLPVIVIADPELTLFFAADRTPPSGRNINYVTDDLLTRLVYAADRTIDREERKRLLREAQIRIAELAVEIPLYNVTKLDAVPASLHGFKGNPTNAGAFWNVHEWELKPGR